MEAGNFPTLWVTTLAALSLSFALLAIFLRRGRNWMVAAAATGVALGIAEAAAWQWTVAQVVTPSSILPHEPPVPGGIKLHPAILPSADRQPARRGRRPRLVFLGDSFTEGLGVPSHLTFASLVGEELDAESVNHGVTGSGTREQALVWRHYSRTWAPDAVVWTFVLNDFLPQIPLGPDYLMRYEPGAAYGSYLLGMVRLAVAKRVVQARIISGYQESLDPALNPEWFATLEGALKEAHAEVARGGGRLLFVIFPLMWDFQNYPFAIGHRHIAAAAARAGAEVVDLLPDFRNQNASQLWVSRFDHHPNHRGHAVAAQRIAQVLRSRPLLTLTEPRPSPKPAQWLAAARTVHEREGKSLEGLRVAMTLAAAAARLAELEGAEDGLIEEAVSFARRCQQETYDRWRS